MPLDDVEQCVLAVQTDCNRNTAFSFIIYAITPYLYAHFGPSQDTHQEILANLYVELIKPLAFEEALRQALDRYGWERQAAPPLTSLDAPSFADEQRTFGSLVNADNVRPSDYRAEWDDTPAPQKKKHYLKIPSVDALRKWRKEFDKRIKWKNGDYDAKCAAGSIRLDKRLAANQRSSHWHERHEHRDNGIDGAVGVVRARKGFQVHVFYKGKQRYIGLFPTVEEGAEAKKLVELNPAAYFRQLEEKRKQQLDIRGVCYMRRTGKWLLRVKRKFIGYYPTREEALLAKQQHTEQDQTYGIVQISDSTVSPSPKGPSKYPHEIHLPAAYQA